MAYKNFKMDTSSMTVAHRNELLESISKLPGKGWWNRSEEPFTFKLTWDEDYNFEKLVRHSRECFLTDW